MSYAHRRTAVLENDKLRLTLLPGGGHIAAVQLKPDGISPLWDPPWETIEPTQYNAERHSEYGPPVEGGLLSGIVGHNLCFDFFGGPSEEEHAAGLYVHGEASFVDWDVAVSGGEMVAKANLPIAQMRFERRLRLAPGSQIVRVTETAENLSGVDRPVGWTQHVTLGPPFLEKGKTIVNMSATASKVFEGDFSPGFDRLVAGAEFQWPYAPAIGGGYSDLRLAADAEASGAYTTQLMNPSLEDAWFAAFSPSAKTLFGYVWKRSDFPWVGIWEENFGRAHSPWRSRTLTRGIEFSASPIPETRRAMVDRGRTFGQPGFRWMPASSAAVVEYALFLAQAEAPAETVERTAAGVRAGGATIR